MKRLAAAFVIVSLLAPGWAREAKQAVALDATPYYDEPRPGLIPRGFLEKSDTCRTDSAFIDSTGSPWFRVTVRAAAFWAPAATVRYRTDAPRQDLAAGAATALEGDKKARLAAIAKHPDWPRRIKRAVHDGQICLDMTDEQLTASWGEPQRKSKAFILGVGEHAVWFYNGKKDEVICVNIAEGRVIGWVLDVR